MLQNIGLGLVCDIDLSEIEFLISNFLCQNVQTTVGGGESEPSLSIQTFCVHTCLMGGGGQQRFDNVQRLVLFFDDFPEEICN